MIESISIKHFIILLGLLFVISTEICIFILKFFNILDIPNQRSSHATPNPTAGGLAIVTSFFIGMFYIYICSSSSIIAKKVYYAWMASCFIIACMSFYDDLKAKPFITRLTIESLITIFVMTSGIAITGKNYATVAPQLMIPATAGYAITFFWITGLTNAYNFMDGLNGMAAGNAVIALSFLGWTAFTHESNFTYIVCAILIAGILGFMIFNFPVGFLFMGDVGSTFLGFNFACLAIISFLYDNSHIPLLTVPLLLLHFIYDTFFTFCRRLMSGDNVFHAHKTHLYQLLNQLGLSHVQVSCLYFVFASVQGLGALTIVDFHGAKQLSVFIPYLILQIVYSIIIICFAKKKNLI